MSTDGGYTWNPVPGLPTDGIRRVEVAISQSNPDILYVVFEDRYGRLHSMYKSTDGGATWTPLDPPDYLYPQGYYNNTIVVHPHNPDIVYAGEVSLHRSLAEGATWESVNGGYADYHYLAFAPDGSLYIANDGGLWRIEDPESPPSPTLTNLNENLGVMHIYHLDANPVDYRAGHNRYSGQREPHALEGMGRRMARCNLGGDNLWRRDEPSVFYATRQLLIMARGTWDWEDESFSVEGISGGFGSDRKCWLCSPVEGDVSGLTATIYVGTYRLWKSEDGGDSWIAISGDLTSGGYDVLNTIGLSPGGDTIYTGSLEGTMYVTFDGGASWNEIFLREQEMVRDIVVNPHNAREIEIYVMIG